MTIKELRKEKGLTLSVFAKSLGIGMSTLTAYEAGKRLPNAKTLAAVKDVYGVELDAAAVEAAAPAKKEKKASAKKTAAPKAEKPAPKTEEAKKPAKKAPAKKTEKPAAEKPAKKTAKAAPAPKAEEAKAAEKPAKKTSKGSAKKGAKAAKTGVVIIQSPMGGEITPEEILSRLGDVDKVYVRIDQNAAYWTKGEESGAINLW